jgi:hypothetical protein
MKTLVVVLAVAVVGVIVYLALKARMPVSQGPAKQYIPPPKPPAQNSWLGDLADLIDSSSSLITTVRES